jgi:hypothetical protein
MKPHLDCKTDVLFVEILWKWLSNCLYYIHIGLLYMMHNLPITQLEVECLLCLKRNLASKLVLISAAVLHWWTTVTVRKIVCKLRSLLCTWKLVCMNCCWPVYSCYRSVVEIKRVKYVLQNCCQRNKFAILKYFVMCFVEFCFRIKFINCQLPWFKRSLVLCDVTSLLTVYHFLLVTTLR